MNKKLGPGILLILAVVLLYLGGIIDGVVGIGLAVGSFVCFIMAIVGGIKKLLGRNRKQSLSHANKHESASFDEYSVILVKSSVEATKKIGVSLDLQSDKYVDRIMYEMIAYSLFITSLHCQREKMPNHKVDTIIESLVDSVSSYTTRIFDGSKLKENRILTSTMQHFYATHVDMPSSGGEMLQTIAKTLMTEYSLKKSKDFTAMTEIVNILGDVGIDLNKTGFSKSLS